MKLPFVDFHILNFLTHLADAHLPMDLLLRKYFAAHKSLGAKDRREMASLLYKWIRWKSLLEEISPNKEKQLHFVKQFQGDAPPFVPNHLPEHVKRGMPLFLYEKIIASWGEEKGKELLSLLNQEAPTTIRVNPAKTSREALYAKWKKRFAISLCTNAPHGIRFHKREPLFSFSEFKEGLFEVQDEGSQEVSLLLDVKPKDLVLDYCSGSGGKTLSFAHKMEGKGQIFLHDIRPLALTQAKKRLKRAGVQNVQFLTPLHPQLKKLIGKCNWVIADVPCSGSGTLRRNPDQKWKIEEAWLQRLILEQREIVKNSLAYLAPNGFFAYITCSLFKEENEEQVSFFLREFDLSCIEKISLPPETGGRDGFFAAIFKKNGSC